MNANLNEPIFIPEITIMGSVSDPRGRILSKEEAKKRGFPVVSERKGDNEWQIFAAGKDEMELFDVTTNFAEVFFYLAYAKPEDGMDEREYWAVEG